MLPSTMRQEIACILFWCCAFWWDEWRHVYTRARGSIENERKTHDQFIFILQFWNKKYANVLAWKSYKHIDHLHSYRSYLRKLAPGHTCFGRQSDSCWRKLIMCKLSAKSTVMVQYAASWRELRTQSHKSLHFYCKLFVRRTTVLDFSFSWKEMASVKVELKAAIVYSHANMTCKCAHGIG